jgi:8-oxo-dGTP diphosphatase
MIMKDKHYSLVFAISEDRKRVLLIRKNRPKWQEGKLNGIGGLFEEQKDLGVQFGVVTPPIVNCTIREFREEASLLIKPEKIKQRGEMRGCNWTVSVYLYYMDLQEESSVQGLTDEKLEWVNIHDLPNSPDVVPNLKWLVNACLDNDMPYLNINYTLI